MQTWLDATTTCSRGRGRGITKAICTGTSTTKGRDTTTTIAKDIVQHNALSFLRLLVYYHPVFFSHESIINNYQDCTDKIDNSNYIELYKDTAG